MARSNVPVPDGAPTMIIPSGTKIEVDSHGQLSIRTPGNLVLQNSGSYGTIESASGSIRIEPNVQVEAVNVECADVCFIQGSLTAWKVKAKSIELEESARAHIILQETEQLQIGREARLVGNFSSEKELFLLMSRFAKQLKQMPFYQERKASIPEELLGFMPEETPASAPAQEAPVEKVIETNAAETAAAKPTPQSQLPDDLFFALVLLEREAGRSGNGPTAQKAVEELAGLLRGRNLAELQETFTAGFSRIVEPSEDILRARELISAHFSNE